MGTNLNFKNFTNDPSSNTGGGGGRPPENFLLARQPSVYSLTFDEFQSTMGGLGKDFGSMNMDELLKNIWSAEENQTVAASSSVAQEGLQRQGSLTLPRTLSQKTVDEVWRDLAKEYGGINNGAGGANAPQRQQTLGEMTLEEFLVRAGVVREDTQVASKLNANGAVFGDLTRTVNNPGLGIGFQGNRVMALNNSSTNQIAMNSSNLPLNVNGIRSNQVQAPTQEQVRHQQIFPKQSNPGYVTQVPLQSSPGIRSGVMGIGDQGLNGGLMPSGAMGMAGLGGVGTGSPASQISSDGISKSNGDTSSVSPVPYVLNGGLRGRRANATVEKVVERRQRRMIKNRESAARSRARKQAYTMELEAEVAKLNEENKELLKKQAEIMEMQKNQAMENNEMQQGSKKRCLRRTQTGPW
ncbi:hypothetical protein K2173_028057 [Erythroxylum novogranatense]|uniref:BZIP domain-containing protein n=1 Tax=Erythroxylum novogranatense TaxID=1862640 RepID=A0AAV8U3E3_9ROSI|nr:hypothetical protein K2173_026936 [Erythroxylum novogranatense]KAJ8772880.1 hypothetical protein K2173_028057 [Erythroxylum novogranatense]